MPLSEHLARIADGAPTAWARETVRRKTVAPGVDLVEGCRKGSRTPEGMAYLFRPDTFSAEQARAWLEERKIPVKSFLAAQPAPAEGEEEKPVPPPEGEEPPEGEVEEETPPEGEQAPPEEKPEGEQAPPAKTPPPPAQKKTPPPPPPPAKGEPTEEKPAEEPKAEDGEGEAGEGEEDDDEGGLELDLPVLAPGKYRPSKGGPLELTAEQLDRMVADTNALIEDGSLRPPAKLGHGEDQDKAAAVWPKGGAPALGWVKRLWRNKAGEYGIRLAAVSERFAGYVRKGLWGPRSAELVENWTHPTTGKTYPLILKAVAWLGSEMPAAPMHEVYGLASDDLDGVLLALAAEADFVEVLNLSLGSHEPEKPATGASPTPRGDDAALAAIVPPRSEPSEKEDLTLTEDLKAQLRAAQEKLVETRLAALVAGGRLEPAEADAQKAVLVELGLDEAVGRLDLMDRFASKTKTTPTGAHDETPPTPKTGEGRLLELTAEIRKADSNVDPGEALIQASLRDPKATREFVRAYGLTKASREEE